MKHPKVVVIVVVVVIAFMYFIPVVPIAVPSTPFPGGIYFCPREGCRWPVYGSVTYWVFGVGGVVTKLFSGQAFNNYPPDYSYTVTLCRYCYN